MTFKDILPLKMNASPPVARVKAAHHFRQHNSLLVAGAEREAKTGRYLMGAMAIGLPLAAVMYSYSNEFFFLPGALGFAAGVFGVSTWLSAKNKLKHPHVRKTAEQLVEKLLADFAAQQPLHLSLDARAAADATEPERTARSPYSGAMKTYHRHRWLEMKGTLASGHLLGLSLTDLKKYRNGVYPMRQQIQIRGRIKLHDAGTLSPPPDALGALRVLYLSHTGEVLFWGTVAQDEEISSTLSAVATLVQNAS